MAEMLLCRTCDTTTATKLYELKTTCNKKYPEKQLMDLWKELIQMSQNIEYEAQMPQHLCGNCMQKLDNAYDFMLQAREAYKRLLHTFETADTKLNINECALQELPLEQFLTVKLEADVEDATIMNFEVARDASDDIEHNDDSDVKQKHKIFNEKEQQFDPLTNNKDVVASEPEDFNSNNEDDALSNNSSGDDDDYTPLIKRKLKLQKAKLKEQQEEQKKKPSFSCDECGKVFRKSSTLRSHKQKHLKLKQKTNQSDNYACFKCTRQFRRKETLEQHLKIAHRITPKGTEGTTTKWTERMLCKSKLAQNIDLNLCRPHGCKLIQCMICLENFTKIQQLQSHLSAHPDILDFSNHKATIAEIAESFYANIKGDITEKALVARIQKDLKAEKFSNFYSITNQAGYELSLDTSDTDSDVEAENNLTYQKQQQQHCYACDLCENIKFRRKYQLYEHQRDQHDWLDAQHFCKRCDARFLSKQLLDHHSESQCRNFQKRFLCNKCPLRFRWKHNRKAHYAEHKAKTTNLKCEQCNLSFDSKKSLTMHTLTVHADADKLMPCHWCSRKFYRYDYFVKHLKRHALKEKDLPQAEMLIKATEQPNGVKRITCKICQLQFERIADLRAHIMMELRLNLSAHQSYDSLANYSITNEAGFELHLDDSETDNDETVQSVAYKCEICQVQCRRRYEMFQHQRAMHWRNPVPHACSGDKCVFRSVSKRILEHHQKTQCQNALKQLSCEYCNYKFMWPENLKLHQQIQHADLLEAKTKTTTDAVINEVVDDTSTQEIAAQQEKKPATAVTANILNCPHCDKIYMHQSWLNNHIRDVHNIGNDSNNKKKKKDTERRFLCSHCGKEASSAAALVTHIRRHTGERPYKCDMCEMRFPRHSEMLEHRRKHTGEKPYHCTVCGKDFAYSHKLKRHTLIHTGMKPYKCALCEKSYRQKKDLNIHMQTHTGDTTIECGTCGERFIERVALENHRIMRGHFEKIQLF